MSNLKIKCQSLKQKMKDALEFIRIGTFVLMLAVLGVLIALTNSLKNNINGGSK